jgi:hypothetical protein
MYKIVYCVVQCRLDWNLYKLTLLLLFSLALQLSAGYGLVHEVS